MEVTILPHTFSKKLLDVLIVGDFVTLKSWGLDAVEKTIFSPGASEKV
jgi:hypothetical protein